MGYHITKQHETQVNLRIKKKNRRKKNDKCPEGMEMFGIDYYYYYFKQIILLLDEVFVMSRIIKVEVSVISQTEGRG